MLTTVLTVDDPDREDRATCEPIPEIWNCETQKKWKLDAADIQTLNEGKTLFRGDTAFYLEELNSEELAQALRGCSL